MAGGSDEGTDPGSPSFKAAIEDSEEQLEHWSCSGSPQMVWTKCLTLSHNVCFVSLLLLCPGGQLPQFASLHHCPLKN